MCDGQRLLPAGLAEMSRSHQTFFHMTDNTSMNLGHGLLPGSSSTTKFHTATGDPFVRLNLENESILSVVNRTIPFYGTDPNIKIWPQSSRLNGDLCARVIVTGGKQAHRLPKPGESPTNHYRPKGLTSQHGSVIRAISFDNTHT